ncbi:MAG: RNA 2'-phosphotransferase [Paludibacteraceae bacterium]|nr:RNA 2'-phosphotransferase [Paludibacteraceae bacterium]
MLSPNFDTSESEIPLNALTPDFPHLSNRLAYLLQHSNLPDKYGWVSVDVLCKESGYKEHIIRTLVLFDDKGRFIFSDDQMKVRALYGHSIKIESDAVPMQPPAVLYHGTAVKSLASILKKV